MEENKYWRLRQQRALEDAVQEKYRVLNGARNVGEFGEAVQQWWRMYDAVRQRSRSYRGVDVVAHEAATDYVDMGLSWR